MPTFAESVSWYANRQLRARLNDDAGAAVAEVPATESTPRVYSWSVAYAATTAGHSYEVREVTAQTTAGFDAGANVFGPADYEDTTQATPPGSYLTPAAADALAATMLPLTYYPAATTGQKTAALLLASIDVDRGMRYQGRKVDVGKQTLEFPRVAYESPLSMQLSSFGYGAATPVGAGDWPQPDNVWDWSPTLQMAVVPNFVLMAVLYQADYTLSGKREKLLDRIEQGLSSDKIGSASETYDLAFLGQLANETLCRRALQMLERYRLKQGRIL